MSDTITGPATAASAMPEADLYRHIIDWDRRLRHEGPFLERVLDPAGGARILVLGSATGEHDRWLSARGASVVGVDRAPDMVAAARAAAAGDPRVQYFEADLAALGPAAPGPFDGALCLGNTLAHLLDEAALRALLEGVAARLRPGGCFLVQVLNHEGMAAGGRRQLAPNQRPDPDGRSELVFLRFFDHPEPGFVEVEAVILRRTPGSPATLVHARRTRLRAWTRAELVPLFESLVGPVTLHGGMAEEPFVERSSTDLVLLARRG